MILPKNSRILILFLLTLTVVIATVTIITKNVHAFSDNHPQYQAACDLVTEIPASECRALVALYNSTNGPNWYYRYGWLASYTPCSWYGVDCYDGHVTDLSLTNNNLNGTIPAQIGDLSQITDFRLADNKLSGTLPSEIGNLTGLNYLHLYNNQLTGSLPPEIGVTGQNKWQQNGRNKWQ